MRIVHIISNLFCHTLTPYYVCANDVCMNKRFSKKVSSKRNIHTYIGTII